MNAVLQIHNLNVHYGSNLAIDDISFGVNSGDLLGVLGPNGSGKTTMFRAILGLHPYEGTVSIFGHNAKIKDLAPLIGYVPQNIHFEPNFPAAVSDIVSMGIPTSRQISHGKRLVSDLGYDLPSTYGSLEKRDEKVAKALDTVGLEHLWDRRIGELSGGEQQRVFIAKSLIKDPLLLILDEPGTNIDASTQSTFYAIIQRLNQQGLTILWSSHDLDSLQKYSNTIVCMDKKLFFYGSTNDLFSNDTILRTYMNPRSRYV